MINFHTTKTYNMKNKVLLDGRLAGYTALACSLLAVQQSDAQMVYTDVDPDAVINSGDVYSFDIDGDALPDFGFVNAIYSSIGALNAILYESGGIVGYLGSFLGTSFPFVSVLGDGSVVGPDLNWYSTEGGAPILWGTFAVVYSLGQWHNVTDKFVGLRFKIGTEFHYGWARLDVSETAITLKDYAYNATPNATISTSGEVGVEQESLFHPVIYSASGILNITLPATDQTATVTVMNMLGTMVHSELISNAAEINLNRLHPGMYLAIVQSGTNRFTYTFDLM
jgi:hypothetical protein